LIPAGILALLLPERWTALVVATMLLLSAASFAFIIGTLIAHRIDELAITARRIANGYVDERARVTDNDEVAQLAMVFNEMVERLQIARVDSTQHDATMERQLSDGNAQLHDMRRQLEIAREQAETADYLKSEFLSAMGHEIRTPMNGILGTLTLALDTTLEVGQRHLLGLAKSSADLLLVIINDILDFSKIEAGKMEISATPFRLRSTCEEVFTLLASEAGKKKITFMLTLDDALPEWLIGDAVRIRQVLFNLTGNAVKFTDRGNVVITASESMRTGDVRRIHFEVRDNGVGIDDITQKRIFQKPNRDDVSQPRSHAGTGLGLVISRKLIELMGGALGLTSSPGKGSVFFFDLDLPETVNPEAVDKTFVTADSDVASADSVSEPDRNGSRRLLVVDDDPVNLTVARAMLHSLGHTVDLARDGSEAVAKARHRRYDAIFMDLQMPKMDGLEATASIRSLPGYQDTPILALTANCSDEIRQECQRYGFQGFLSKPIAAAALWTAASRWLKLTP